MEVGAKDLVIEPKGTAIASVEAYAGGTWCFERQALSTRVQDLAGVANPRPLEK